MSPNLEPVNFQRVQERSPETWKKGMEFEVEGFGNGTYRVEENEEEYLVRLVSRGSAWHGWCECNEFDGLETCPHICSAAIKSESIEEVGGD